MAAGEKLLQFLLSRSRSLLFFVGRALVGAGEVGLYVLGAAPVARGANTRFEASDSQAGA